MENAKKLGRPVAELPKELVIPRKIYEDDSLTPGAILCWALWNERPRSSNDFVARTLGLSVISVENYRLELLAAGLLSKKVPSRAMEDETKKMLVGIQRAARKQTLKREQKETKRKAWGFD